MKLLSLSLAILGLLNSVNAGNSFSSTYSYPTENGYYIDVGNTPGNIGFGSTASINLAKFCNEKVGTTNCNSNQISYSSIETSVGTILSDWNGVNWSTLPCQQYCFFATSITCPPVNGNIC
jgi:hypothetical protein